MWERACACGVSTDYVLISNALCQKGGFQVGRRALLVTVWVVRGNGGEAGVTMKVVFPDVFGASIFVLRVWVGVREVIGLEALVFLKKLFKKVGIVGKRTFCNAAKLLRTPATIVRGSGAIVLKKGVLSMGVLSQC